MGLCKSKRKDTHLNEIEKDIYLNEIKIEIEKARRQREYYKTFNYVGPFLCSEINYGSEYTCILFLEHCDDINVKDETGRTPLMFASIKNYNKLCKILISRGAYINAQDNCGYTALIYSILHNKKQIAELLVSYKADIDDESLDLIPKNEWTDLYLKICKDKAFDRRKHLLESYYSYTY